MKPLIRAPLAALAALWAGAVLAQGAPATPATTQLDRLAILLDLTPAQQAQVQPILAAQHVQMKQLMDQMRVAGSEPDFESLRAARQQIRQDTLAKLSGVLSSTQLKKLQTLQQMAHHRFGRGFGPPGGAAPGSTTAPQD
ncbi:MAG TPA: hypothetical protein VEU54_01960 [Steroidobacteraceae bacterium]|jgi:hypothetical protein|nr:hypothetical protein [Steroidobacteraceae bacterium]